MIPFTPIVAIFLIGAGISIATSLINKKFLGTGLAKEVKEKMNGIRAKMLEAQKSGNVNTVNECIKEMMKTNSEYMKFMFKPMIISIVLVLLVMPLVSNTYQGLTVATIPSSFPVIGGYKLSWFWWYFICTFVVSTILRKLFEF
jgi:uncharacterized membrane protein (DUF106 family)